MDAKLLYSILSNAWDSGVHDSPPRSYSGRFMYGARCIAVEVSEPADLIRIAFWAGQAYGEQLDAEQFLRNMRSDSLGLGMIYYWPDQAWDEQTMQERD